MEIATLVLAIIGEVGKIASDAITASHEELAELRARCERALAELVGTRREVENSIDHRHAEAHEKLDEKP